MFRKMHLLHIALSLDCRHIIVNRQKAWYLGYHPEGVDYYLFKKEN